MSTTGKKAMSQAFQRRARGGSGSASGLLRRSRKTARIRRRASLAIGQETAYPAQLMYCGTPWIQADHNRRPLAELEAPDKRASEGDILDDLWVKEQLLIFVREALEGGPPRLLSRPWLSKRA